MEDKIKYLEENIEREKDMVKRMKEMSKLIELLNEYNKEITNEEIGWKKRNYDEEFWNLLYWDYNWWTFSEMYCISKRYGFIKRLVENDKIDMSKAKYYSDLIYYEDYWEWDWACKDYEFVIMLLSIQDNSTEFLISVLK